MGGLFGQEGGNATKTTKYTGIDVQTSAAGVCVPIIWGRVRVGGNLIWAGDFQNASNNGKKGGKKNGKKGASEIAAYQAALVMALCEGQIYDVGTVWQDKDHYKLSDLGWTLFSGSASQAAWSYLTTNHPSQALTYAYTAYVADSALQLGNIPTVPNHNFEVMRAIARVSGSISLSSMLAACGWWICDQNPADCLVDLLVSPQFGYAVNYSNFIDDGSVYWWARYCDAVGIHFSPCLNQQETVAQVIDRWAQLTNTWIFWSGHCLKFLPLGDNHIQPSGYSQTESYLTSIPLGSDNAFGMMVSVKPQVGTDLGVKYQDTGASLTYIGTIGSPAVGQYVQFGNTYQFNPAEAGRPIIITYIRTFLNIAEWNPAETLISNINNSIRFNFTYDDFIQSGSEGPVTVTRADQADMPNHVKLQIKDRNNAYNSYICEWKDQGLVDQFGQIDANVTQADEICDPFCGQVAAQLIGQRGAYIRNTYEFTIGMLEGSILEPGDVVTLTEPHIGLTQFPVRIRTLEEDSSGNWKIEAEEYPGIVGIVEVGAPQANPSVQNTPFATTAVPPSINPPAVWEPDSSLTNGVAQLWIAASGNSKSWGGCVVHISFNGGATYTTIGIISGAATQGVLTGTLASHADPDSVNTLSVDTTESLQILAAASHADADAHRTLALITNSFSTVLPTVGEALAYGAVAATGTYTANLTYLRRGLLSSTIGSHASGSYFTLFGFGGVGNGNTGFGPGVLVYNIPPQYANTTITLKFTSFNNFGAQQQSMASATAYTYAVTGRGYGGGSTGGGATGVPTTPSGLTATSGVQSGVLAWNLNPVTDNVQHYNVYRATGLGAAFGSASLIGTATSPNYTDTGLSVGANFTYFVTAVNAVGESQNSSGANLTVGSVSALRYDIDSWMYGAQSVATQLIRRFQAPRSISIPTSGHQAGADNAATGSTTFTIKKNGVSAGTVNFAASATTGTFTISSPISLVAGDVIEIFGPATGDATLANVNIILAGTA